MNLTVIIYTLLASCLVGALVSYPFFYNIFIFPKEIEKFNNYLKEEQADQALSVLNNLPEKKKKTLQIHLAFSEAHLMKQHWYLSLFHLNEIIKLKLYTHKTIGKTSKVSIHLKKANIYENIKKYENAITEYTQILKVDPKNLQATTEIGKRFFEMKNYTAALSYLEESYSQNSKNPKVNELLCSIYLVLETYDRALLYIQGAIRHSNPVHCRLRHKEVLCLFYLKRYPETISVGESIEKTYNKIGEIEIIVGVAHYELGNFEKAEELFQANLSKYTNNYSPNILEARYLYSKLLLEKNSILSALEQMSFIQKGHKSYKDVDKYVEVYEKINKDTVLYNFFLQKSEITEKALTDYFTEDYISFLSGFKKISSKPNLFITKAEIIATHEKILICINTSAESIHSKQINTLAEIQKQEHAATGISLKRLFYFSLFNPISTTVPNLKIHFEKVKLISDVQFLETVKNKKFLFIEPEPVSS